MLMGKWKILAAGLALLLGASGTAVRAESVDYPQAMVKLICDLKAYSAEKKPGFGLIGNGGAGLFLEQDGNTGENVGRLLQALDGTMAESVNYRWEVEQGRAVRTNEADTEYFHQALAPAVTAGLPVLSLDYVDAKDMAEESYQKNQEKGYIPWASFRRELDALPQDKPFRCNGRDMAALSQVQNYLVLLNPGNFGSRETYLEALRGTDYDLLIVDLFYGPEPLTAGEVASLKQKAHGGRRLVYAYMSVGEAETYRYYWQREWQDKGLRIVPISVNCSRSELLQNDFLHKWFKPLKDSALSSQYMHLEVTESLFTEHFDKLSEVLRECQQRGVKIELDDFGTGYSSLSMFQLLPLDIIKFDMAFVKGLDSPRQARVMAACVRLVHNLGLKSIAEGVETSLQLEKVKEMGIDAVQGYYYSRPLPKAEFEQYLMSV